MRSPNRVLTESFKHFFDTQKANLESPLELPLLSVLELSAIVQEQWQGFMTTAIVPAASESGLKKQFGTVASTLHSFLESLLQAFVRVEQCTLGQQTILCATIEYCLTDVYANFSHQFSPLIDALAQIDLSRRSVVMANTDAIFKDQMDAVISKVAGFILVCAKLHDRAAIESDYLLRVATDIANTANMLLASLGLVKVRVNRERMSQQEQDAMIAERIKSLTFSGHVILRRLGRADDPIHQMLMRDGASLLLPSMRAIEEFTSTEAAVAGLEEELAGRMGPKSPADLRMMRLLPFVPIWCQQILEAGQRADMELFTRSKNAAQLLAGQFSAQEYPLEHAQAQTVIAGLDDYKNERERLARQKADDIAKELVDAESSKRARKKGKKSEIKSADSKEEPSSLAEPPMPLDQIAPVAAIMPEQIYSAEEIFLTSLEKSRKTPNEKIKSLDRYCRENAKAFEKNLAAQVFFELARSAWLRATNPPRLEFKKQLSSLHRLLAQGEYCEWLDPERVKIEERLGSGQRKNPGEMEEVIAVKPLIAIALPALVAVILAALSEPDQIGKFPRKAYVVGGFVRDQLRELENNDIDIDIVALGYPKGFYKSDFFHEQLRLKLSQQLECELNDIKISLSRLGNLLIISVLGKRFEIWFSAAKSLEKDAQLRDFSFNALYADEKGLVHEPIPHSVTDACGSVKGYRMIPYCRAINLTTFFNDPLRLLRLLDYKIIREFVIDDELTVLCGKQLDEIRSMDEKKLIDYLGSKKEHFALRLKKLLFAAIEKNSKRQVLAILRSLGLEVLLLMMPEDCGKLYGHVPFTSAMSEMKKRGADLFGSEKSSPQAPPQLQAKLS